MTGWRKRQVMEMALEALEANQPVNYCMNSNGEKFPMMHEDPLRFERNTKAIAAIKEALAHPEQEPVATVTSESGHPDVTMSWWHEPALPIGTKLYTTPPQRKETEPVGQLLEAHSVLRQAIWDTAEVVAPPQRAWVGLTDEEIDHFCHLAYTGDEELVLTIQAKLKEKNA